MRKHFKITSIGYTAEERKNLLEKAIISDQEFHSEERVEGVEGQIHSDPFHVYTLNDKLTLDSKS